MVTSNTQETATNCPTYLENVSFAYYQGEDETLNGQTTSEQTVDAQTVSGIEQVTLSFAPGSCTLITGPSGSGKSTILKLLTGLIPQLYKGKLTGQVMLAGQDCAVTDIQTLGRSAGMVFQNPASQFFTATVREELAFGGENAAEDSTRIGQNMREAIHIWDLQALADRRLRHLSGGEQQLVACAVAVSGPQRILLLDEPTSNLAPSMIAHFQAVIAQLKKQGWTIIVAEHRLYPLQGLADQVAVMNCGKVVQVWSGPDFFALGQTRRRELGLRTLTPPTHPDLPRLTIKQNCPPTAPNPCVKSNTAATKTTPRLSKENNSTTTMPVQTQTGQVDGGSDMEKAGGISIKNLRFAYGSHRVLDIAHLELPAGQVIALTGPNGAGKSTLARILIGLREGQKGTEIRFAGQLLPARRRLGRSALVMQDMHRQLFAPSVQEELTLGGTKLDKDQIERLITQLGLNGLEQRHPMSLSGGQKQRLVIAASLVTRRDLYVFDEPTSGVDFAHLVSISERIRALAACGKTVLVISHDPEFIDQVADQEFYLEPLGRNATSPR